MIHLIGPGGAGKSTTGKLLAKRLGASCVDLDEVYLARASKRDSDIGRDIAREGYETYVRRNVDLYLERVADCAENSVVVTSSGFMVYSAELHPAIAGTQRDIEMDPCTLLLMPSFDKATCVATIVERQLTRAHLSRTSAAEHESVIADRFDRYALLRVKRIVSAGPVDKVVANCRETLSL